MPWGRPCPVTPVIGVQPDLRSTRGRGSARLRFPISALAAMQEAGALISKACWDVKKKKKKKKKKKNLKNGVHKQHQCLCT